MLNKLYKILFLELERFMGFVKIYSTQKFSNNPFVKGPDKICYKVFKHLSHRLIEDLYTVNEAGIETWNGFRLL